MRKIAVLLLLLAGAFAGDDDEPRVWVHAPAEDLLALYPERGGGFLISIEEYNKLLELAKANREADREQPPLPARLVSGAAQGRIEDDLLRLEATYVAVVKGDRPAEVPFLVRGVALEEIAVEGGELVGDALRFEQAGTYAVTVRLAARLDRKGDRLQSTFRLPAAASHTVTLALPADVEGEVGPIVRSFRTAGDGGSVVGFPSRDGVFGLWLQPRTRARELEPLLSASFGTIASVGEASTLTSTNLELEILRAPLARVELRLPEGQLIRALNGKGVKSWRLAGGKLEIAFVEPVQDRVSLQIEAELPRGDGAKLDVPVVRVPGAVRYRGTVGVVGRPEVRVTSLEAEGARRLDQAPKGGVALFEVWSPESRVTAVVERVAVETRAFTYARLDFQEGGKRLHVSFAYTVEGEPLFRLEPQLPAGWILRRLLLDRQEAEHRYGEDGRLVLTFPQGLAPGTHVLQCTLETDEVDWVPAEGATTFALPALRAGLDEERGFLVVTSDTAFRVGAEAVAGLETVGLSEVFPQQEAPENSLYAWRFQQPGYAARFRLARHRPQIQATVVNRVRPSERLLATHATVLLDIQRAGVRELQIALPKGAGPLVDFQGPLIKEKRAPEADADPEVWTLVFQTRIRGAYRLEILFDRKFEQDAWTAPFPEIAVPGAQERGFLVVHAGATTAVSVEADGLRAADIDELPAPEPRPPLEVLAYARHPYEAKVASRRHEPHEVVQAVALSADIYGVLSPEGRLRCRAEYRIRNNDQPFLPFALPKGSTLVGALVDGKPSKPLVEKGWLKVPLPRSRDRETPFLVSVVYESEVEGLRREGEVTVARPLLLIDVLKTTYTLHLPKGYRLTGHDGDMVPLSRGEQETVLGELGRFFVDETFHLVPKSAVAEDRIEQTLRFNDDGEDWRARRESLFDKGDRRRADEEPAAEKAKAGEDFEQETPEEAEEDFDEIRRESVGKLAERVRTLEDGMAIQEHLDKLKDLFRLSQQHADNAKQLAELGEVIRQLGDGSSIADPSARERYRREVFAPYQQLIARAGGAGAPTPAPGSKAVPKRKRPERALLSLDVQFLKPDNVYRLDSLAPSGAVKLTFARGDVFETRGYLGAVLGAAAALVVLLRGGSVLRLLGAGVLFVLALHFGGLSFLPEDFALGAGRAVVLLLLAFLLVRLVRRLARIRLRRPRWPFGGRVAGLLLLAALVQADEEEIPEPRPANEILVPYRGDQPSADVERVFLPADRYHELRRLAYPETAGRRTAFAKAEYAVKLEKEDLTVAALYEIVKETEEAERVPLRLDGVAVTFARLDDAPAKLAVEKDGYVLVLAGKGRHTLELTLRPRLDAKGARRTFAVPVRPVAGARMVLTHDREGHDVKVVALGGESDGAYALGPVGVLGATWTPETEGFKAEEAELRAETETLVSVRDGFTAVAARIRYGVAGGEVERLSVRTGKDLVVRAVRAPDLAGWEVDGEGVLRVALGKPARQNLVLEIVAERRADREREEAVPAIEPLGVLRDAGVIALETLPDLKIEILEAQGLLRGVAAQAPQGLSGAPDAGVLHSVHRYAVRPFALRWRVTVEETRLRAETSVDVVVEKEQTLASVQAKVEVERGPGPFEVRLRLPVGYDVVAVQGNLREWWVEEGVLVFARAGRQPQVDAYGVTLRRKGPTAESFDLPAVSVVDAVRETGRVRVGVADGLELAAVEASNLLPLDVAKAGALPWGQLRRAYRFVATPWRLVVSSREEAREVEAIVVSRLLPLADRLRVEALLNFHVRRGLVDEVSFVVPVAEESGILVSAPDLREERSEETEAGRRYTLQLRSPTRGSVAVAIAYDLPLDEPAKGVEPLAAERVQRFVAVEKVPDGQVRVADLANLETGDFDDLPLKPAGSGPQTVAGVFVGTGEPFALSVDVERHSFEEVATAMIYRASAQAVVARSGWTRVLVSYRVFNRAEQFLRLRLPDGAKLYSVFVAGEGVRPLVEGRGLLVPLRKLAIGAPTFDVDVVYAYGGPEVGSDDFEVRLPEVEQLDVRRSTLSLYLPQGYTYSFDTRMDEVDEGKLAAGEATDTYEELKELYAVAERGNAAQAQRAFSNVQELQQNAWKRLAEKAQSAAKDEATVQQIQAQERALSALEDSLQSKQTAGQAGYVAQNDKKAPDVQQWDVNEGYLKRFKAADNKALDEFRRKNVQRAQSIQAEAEPQGPATPGGDPGMTDAPFEAGRSAIGLGGGAGGRYRGASGGVPPGLREPSDAGPPAPADYAPPVGAVALDRAGQLHSGAPLFFASREDEAAALDTPVLELPDADSYVLTFSVDEGKAALRPQALQGAKGRISIRIDLPREGQVFHFARLGPDSRLEIEADEEDGAFLEGLLALLCGAAAFLLIRRG